MNIKLIILFILLSSFVSSAQPDSVQTIIYPVTIDSVYVTGNDITEGHVILRELTIETGDTVNAEIINYNKERVYSLGLFTKVDFIVKPAGERHLLNIAVEEAWYIYPLPFVELKDNDWNEISYGAYLVVKNFRGRNETIRSKIGFGYDPSYSIGYYMPEIVTGSNVFLNVEASYLTAANVSDSAIALYGNNFNHKMFSSQIVLGKRINLFHWLSINVNYNYIETPFFIKGISASNERIDRFPSAGINYSYDTRDLAQFPKKGVYFGTTYQWKGFGINDINYAIFSLDFREYVELIGDLHGKWRYTSRFAIGEDIPFYDYSYVGLGERIRGYYNEQHEGHNLYLGSVELFYPVIKDYQLNFEWVPLLPNSLLRYRIALYTQIFFDSGAIQKKDQPLSINDFNTGLGAGITFLILPYNSLRFEIAFDENFNSQFVFDLGVSF